ncbi:MAG TPA: hypothetical protein VGB08_02925 [Allosphingosinicella sp.]|jgi:hypothetical protein
MSILFAAALLLGPSGLPEIDRRSLDLQARAEALQPRLARSHREGLFELEAMTTVCRAAGSQTDPRAFLATLSRAYGLSATETAALRGSCAAYLAGRADGRR